MVVQAKVLKRIAPKTILVAGDLLLDQYTFGVTKRISPEAPVPVLLVTREESKAGGAGNVALNLMTLGMKVKVLGRVGEDAAGERLLFMLNSEGVDVRGVFHEKGFLTPTKTRCIAGAQQLLRVDKELSHPIHNDVEAQVLASIPQLVEGVDLIAISDYAKGFLSDQILRLLIDCAKKKKIPCIVDPKGTDFVKYSGCTVIKPNETETLCAVPGSQSLESAAFELLKNISVSALMITRSEAGSSLFYPSGKVEHYPVIRKEVRDCTGAGDTALAMLSAALASGLSLQEAIPLANIAAACCVEVIGCARVSLRHVADHLLNVHHSEKICTGESFCSILEVLQFEKLLLIQVPAGSASSEKLVALSAIARQYPDRYAVACFSDKIHEAKFLELVASLEPFRLVVHDVRADIFPANLSPNHMLVSLS